MDINKFWFSPSRNQEKNIDDISTECPIFNVGQKHWFLLTFQERSSDMIDFFGGWVCEIFIDLFINQKKILHVACHILSQIDVTKTLRPIQAVIIF